MAKTVVGLYDSISDARQVVQDLTAAGFHRDKISLVASDAKGEYSSNLGTTTTTTTTRHDDADTGSGAATGAVAGGLLGGLAGVLLGLGALAIPGIGPVIAAGPIVSGLVGAGIGAASGGLLGALVGMGVSKEEAEYYSEGVRRGGTLVTVNAPDDKVDRVVEIMNRYNPVDIEKRSEEWRGQGWTGYDPDSGRYYDYGDEKLTGTAAHGTTHTGTTAHVAASTATGTTGHERGTMRSTEGKTTIPIVEEDVRVGKRAVERGGVRVHTFIEEKPFQEQVSLREEEVHVERRSVDRPASEADLKAFKEGTIELRERGEEVVVSKEARVVEEVVIGKDVREHTETVHDTVRRTGVKVDEMTGTTRTMSDVDRFGADREYFRNHFKTNFSKLGGTYEEFEPAYRSGYTLGYDDRYKTYNRWEDLEPEARRMWEKDNRGVWDKAKDAVRHGWERAKQAV